MCSDKTKSFKREIEVNAQTQTGLPYGASLLLYENEKKKTTLSLIFLST